MSQRMQPFAAAVLAIALVLAAPSFASAQADGIRTISLEMYLDLESASDPQISPDGSQVVYTRGWVDKMNDRRESSVWIMNADGSRARFRSNLVSRRDSDRLYLGRRARRQPDLRSLDGR